MGSAGRVPDEACGLATFLAAAARWLGATEVVWVAAEDPTSSDPLAAVGRTWLAAGADPSDAVVVAGDDRLDLVAVAASDGGLRGTLVIRRPVRKPRPAAQADRIAAVAALTARVLDVGGAVPMPSGDVEARGHNALVAALRRAGAGAVLVVGIDRLAVVNEVFERLAGDLVIETVRDRLVDWAGPEHEVVRLSGTRFGVMRGDLADPDAALAAAWGLRDTLAQPIAIGGLPVSRSVSIGVAAGAATTADEIITQARRGSLAARESGGDTVRSYDTAAADERLGRLRLELELDDALRSGQLRLFYQPEFDLRTGQLLAVEALLRWEHPRLGLVRADAFVDDTERSRTFAAVQMWVVEEACRQLAAWQPLRGARGLGLRINVSAWQIARSEVTDNLLATIDHYGLAPENVCIELTERRMPRHPGPIADPLRRLSAHGLSIAIDDFGTGQGTISQLTTLPVDTIKIDQSFVAAMRTDPRADAVVAGVIALAASLELETVAEGVDGADTAARLVQLGCTRGQGNALGEAMPGDQVERLLQA